MIFFGLFWKCAVPIAAVNIPPLNHWRWKTAVYLSLGSSYGFITVLYLLSIQENPAHRFLNYDSGYRGTMHSFLFLITLSLCATNPSKKLYQQSKPMGSS